ncbi:glycoside hydrolase family 172 protein [Phenylobacterium sp.]|jgi:hypothetical protein|uniref:glycoside hydrolase family 172 protein n=1 Tax=Phenylobacterium sp. TaxID=1871053 RepID=UPI002F3F4B74
MSNQRFAVLWRGGVSAILAAIGATPSPAAAQSAPTVAGVQTLFLLSDARSRQIGPENLTGEPGMGARTELKDGSAKYAAKDLGRGWKVNPYIIVAPGKTIVLGDAKGPGVINHIWMTLGGAADYRSAILRFYWDGEATPSVETPAGDFFAAGWGRGAEPVINSQAVAVNPGSGFNSFWQMPFRKEARLTLENRGARTLVIYYAIDFSETAVPSNAGYFHAQFRMGKADPGTGDYTLLDGVRGQGQYVGTYLRHRAFSPGWWGEGEAKFYIDGDKDFPTIAGTGEEDYFLGSYSYQRRNAAGQRVETSYSSAYAGFLSVQDQVVDADYFKPGDRRYGEYRWHILDPVRFRRDLKVTIQNLGWKGVTPTKVLGEGAYLPLQDELSSVAYWYQAEPHAPFPPLPADAAMTDLTRPAAP